jgi:hypothetical protein
MKCLVQYMKRSKVLPIAAFALICAAVWHFAGRNSKPQERSNGEPAVLIPRDPPTVSGVKSAEHQETETTVGLRNLPPLDLGKLPTDSIGDLEYYSRELAVVTNSTDFRDGLNRLIDATNKLPHRDRGLVWQRLQASLNERVAPIELLHRLNAVEYDIRERSVQIRTDEGSNLWDDMISATLPSLGSNEFTKLKDAVAELKPGSYKSSWEAAILARELANDPVVGAPKLAQLEPAIRRAVEQTVLINLAYRQPELAMRYFMDNRDDTIPAPFLVQRVVLDFAVRSPEVAATIVEETPASVRRDAAIVALVKGFAGTDRNTAALWAAQIADPKLREETQALPILQQPQ